MPVFESIVPSHMNFPRSHRLYQGIEAGQNVNEADVIVVLENDAPWSPRRKKPSPDARVISIAEDPLYERYPVRSFQSDLNLEINAVKMYNKAVEISREAGDNASRELFERLLKDEEAHVDWLEAQMHQINEIGYERYLTQQIKDDAK